VTVVFTDVTGSTSLGEGLDPEALRKVMSRYFDEMSAAVERHGGVVEKFIGDAVMAVFGIPQLHEDDALRAIRAAVEMRDALTRLNRELGMELQARTGVNTGEVVAGDPSAGQRLVTGDAVNVAARLEQTAAPNEILLGALTHSLVPDAVEAERVEPLELKGKSRPVEAYLLRSVRVDVPAFTRRIDAPFVARTRELAMLENELARVVEEESCRLVTVLGSAGVGKSRLVRELVTRAGDRARVLVGRCLPYGEGITFWPLVEIVRQLGEGDARRLVRELVSGDEHADAITERIAAAIGQADSAGATEETFWSVRKLLEALARERPLIVVVDDIQWAEPTFLDLLEYVLAFSSASRILLVCVARAEVLEGRPGWTAPRPNATSLLLEPLGESDAETLVERLLEGRELSHATRERILAAAEGNPLFVEQMLALQTEQGNGEVEVPPTIQALLASRIDHLEPDERAVVERAAVEGRLFHRGAVAELVPEAVRPAVAAHLLALVRKELVRPDRAEFPGDDGFRFGHVLIRDAAYAALPKELRADLHERYAAWLDRKTQGTHEYDEIMGYHLEQAYRYRRELGERDESLGGLGERAGRLLGGAAERAFSRVDLHAGISLAERAIGLLPPDDPGRDDLRFALGDALTEAAEYERALEVLDQLAEDAARRRDIATTWQARLRAAWGQIEMLNLDTEGAAALARQAVEALTPVGDDIGLALAWQVAAQDRNFNSDVVGMQAALEQAHLHAQRAGAERLVRHSAFWLGMCAFFGPAPRPEALETCRRMLDAAANPIQETNARFWVGAVRALGGELEGLDEVRAARRMYAELGLRATFGGTSIPTSWLELLNGDPESAERTLREGIAKLVEAGEKGYRSGALLQLAYVLCELGRYDEAEGPLAEGAELTMPGDAWNVGYIGLLRARLALARGRGEEAETLARGAIEAFEETGPMAGDGPFTFARILLALGKTDEAHRAAEQAIQRYEQKGIQPGVDRVRAVFVELEPA